MTEATKNLILPNYPQSGRIALSYDLDSAEFYTTFIKYQGNFMLEAIGIIFVVILFIKYSVKALATVPESLNPGNIIPHILAFKVGALLLYPTYLEYVQFCTGFMSADFPWANQALGEVFANPDDTSPVSFLIFYVNMNVGAMYFVALLVIALLAGLSILLGKKLKKEQKMHAYLRFLYNFFIFGATFAGLASLQGSILNPVLSISANSFFYILGILVYCAIFCENFFKIYRNHVVYFWRFRVLVKASILCLAHFSPIYLLTVAVMVDIILIAAEYRICRYPQYFGRWWLFANIAANLALIMLVFLPVIELSLLLISLTLGMVIACEAVMHYREVRNNLNILKIP